MNLVCPFLDSHGYRGNSYRLQLKNKLRNNHRLAAFCSDSDFLSLYKILMNTPSSFLRRTTAVLSIIILVGLLLCPLPRKTSQEIFGSSVRQVSSFVMNFNSDGLGRPSKKLTNEELTDMPKSPKSSGYGRRYALAEDYWEELTMATWNFMGLVKVASSWGAHAVLPFTHNSYLYGISGQYPFDLMYDMDDVKRVCDNYFLLMPVRFNHFLSVGSRDVVFMLTDYWSGRNVEKCSHSQRSLMTPVLQHLNKVAIQKNLQLFREVDCCVVYSQHPTTSGEIAEACNLVGRENFTVLMKTWRGISNNYKKTYRLIADVREDVTINADFKHSKWIIGNATRFFHDVTDTEKCIAVHVRAEALVLDHKVDRCFKLLRKLSLSSDPTTLTSKLSSTLAMRNWTCLGPKLIMHK